MGNPVYVSYLIDCNWHGFSPLKPSSVFADVGYTVGTPEKIRILEDINTALGLVERSLGGKCNWSILSHPDQRYLLYREPFLDCWREAVRQGGELSLHPHEDIPREGSRIKETGYMRAVLEDLKNVMAREGLSPNSFRSGYFGRNDELPAVLAELGLAVDFSSAPGYKEPSVEADWVGAPPSGGFIRAGDAASYGPGDVDEAGVFMIPLGWDGAGGTFTENYLFNEAAELDTLLSVYAAIRRRAETEGPQFVQYLFHLSAMNEPRFTERVADFVGHLVQNGGVIVTGSEASEVFRKGSRVG